MDITLLFLAKSLEQTWHHTSAYHSVSSLAHLITCYEALIPWLSMIMYHITFLTHKNDVIVKGHRVKQPVAQTSVQKFDHDCSVIFRCYKSNIL